MMCAAVEFYVAGDIADRIRLAAPQPTEWQRTGNQIDATIRRSLRTSQPSDRGGAAVARVELQLKNADDLKKRGWSLGWVSAIDCKRANNRKPVPPRIQD